MQCRVYKLVGLALLSWKGVDRYIDAFININYTIGIGTAVQVQQQCCIMLVQFKTPVFRGASKPLLAFV